MNYQQAVDGGTKEPEKLAGRYRLDAEIARGGMAVVWKATDEVLNRTVAAKILHEHLAGDEVFRERFRIEALAAARLAHPNIVAVFDTGDHDGKPFIVMEYLAGGTLKDRIAGKGALDSREAARIGAEVCAALAYAHKGGIIHRDVKPANILFSERALVKVGDFGIAKAAFAPNDLTDTGAVLGTVRYLAPEQVQGDEPGPAADIYSLGVVLYESVTGKAPFIGASDLATATARIDNVPPSPRDLRPSVPRDLDAAIMKALAPSAANRFGDAGSFEAALRQIAGETPPRESTVHPRSAPAHGPAHAPASFVRSEGRWLVPTILLLMLAAGLILAVPALRGRLEGVIPGTVDRAPNQTEVSIIAGGTFDPPPGDGNENDGDVKLAFDGNEQTAWTTVNYASAQLGGLKEGVGIFIDLGKPTPLSSIRVQSVTPGWRGAIRHSPDTRTWSQARNPSAVSQNHEFNVDGSHRYWMIWITSLVRTEGQGTVRNPYSVGIAEIEVSRE